MSQAMRTRDEIVEYMEDHVQTWHTPKEIGIAFGKPPHLATSWACRHLKNLIKYGLVEVDGRGCYAVKGTHND